MTGERRTAATDNVDGVADRDEIADYLGEDSVPAAYDLIFNPNKYRFRALEFVDLTGTTPARQTTLEYAGLPPKVLVPIAFPRKGDLIDTIRIEKADGITPTAISREATIAATRAILIEAARAVEPGQISAEIAEVCDLVPVLPIVEAAEQIDLLRDLMLLDRGTTELADDQIGLITVLQLFGRRVPLFIPCDVDGTLVKITLEADVSHVDMQHRGFREAARSAVGRAPDWINFNTPLATRARSYHFRLKAPSDYFIRDAQIFTKLRTDIRHDQRRVAPSYERLPAATAGLSGTGSNPTELAHLHISEGADLRQGLLGLTAQIRIAERPMGRIGAAALRLLLVLVAGTTLPLTGTSVVVSTNATIATIILGLPALLGATLVIARGGSRLREPLLARVGSGAAVVAAVALSITLAIWTIDASAYRIGHPTAKSFDLPLGVKLSFLIISLATAAAFVNLVSSFTRNTFRYWQSLRSYRKRRR